MQILQPFLNNGGFMNFMKYASLDLHEFVDRVVFVCLIIPPIFDLNKLTRKGVILAYQAPADSEHARSHNTTVLGAERRCWRRWRLCAPQNRPPSPPYISSSV